MRPDILVVGDVLLDITVKVKGLPIREGEHQVSKILYKHGGGTCNFLIAAARLGLRTSVIDLLGDDDEGRLLASILTKEGVDTSGLMFDKGYSTIVTLVIADSRGRHSFVGIERADAPLSPRQVDQVTFETPKVIYMEGYILTLPSRVDAALHFVRKWARSGVTFLFDPGPLFSSIPEGVLDEIMKKVDVLLLNLDEAKAMSGKSSAEMASSSICQRGPSRVVVKLGAGGCYIFEKGRGLRVPGFKVKVEDTSAAGDVFNAAFTYGLLHRATFSHAALLANAAAAIKVTELGGGEEAASERQLKGFLKGRSVSMNLG